MNYHVFICILTNTGYSNKQSSKALDGPIPPELLNSKLKKTWLYTHKLGILCYQFIVIFLVAKYVSGSYTSIICQSIKSNALHLYK